MGSLLIVVAMALHEAFLRCGCFDYPWTEQNVSGRARFRKYSRDLHKHSNIKKILRMKALDVHQKTASHALNERKVIWFREATQHDRSNRPAEDSTILVTQVNESSE